MHDPHCGVLAGERWVWPEGAGDRQLPRGAQQLPHNSLNRVRFQLPLPRAEPLHDQSHHLRNEPKTDISLSPGSAPYPKCPSLWWPCHPPRSQMSFSSLSAAHLHWPPLMTSGQPSLAPFLSIPTVAALPCLTVHFLGHCGILLQLSLTQTSLPSLHSLPVAEITS